MKKCQDIIQYLIEEERNQYFPLLDHELKKDPLHLQNIDEKQILTQQILSKRYEKEDKALLTKRDKIVRWMENYKTAYPAETMELIPRIESLAEYRSIYKKLEEDDLPKFEQRFKDLLKEKTIQDIALFREKLESYAKTIEESIIQINKSLKEIEYNPGTYIKLIADKALDVEIKEFKAMLLNCLKDSFASQELYSEHKFKEVKNILDRFNDDVNWTQKVTDVRNWFTFSASERWIEDDMEKEFYSDSSGKSGGQKEKLAYTILASALAYQFGMEWQRVKSHSFRFVVIDEAFGRGSDESTKYALELFNNLDLQLLIVTPMQKINVIEKFVSTINFVANEKGNHSVVKTLFIEEYQKSKLEKELVLGMS